MVDIKEKTVYTMLIDALAPCGADSPNACKSRTFHASFCLLQWILSIVQCQGIMEDKHILTTSIKIFGIINSKYTLFAYVYVSIRFSSMTLSVAEIN